jgi:Na+-transporting NADH:ubiquinone oxidoreductase subunit C
MDSAKKTITVAALLCIVCSVLVSTTYVTLKPKQDKNAVLDAKKFILGAANLYDGSGDIESIYADKIEEKVLDIEAGVYAEIAGEAFDLKKEPEVKLANDPAGIGKARKREKVFLIKDGNGGYSGVILNIKGQGLWNLMWAYLALKNDGNTVIGLKYYQQGETPGLGAEVENPRWFNQWVGNKVYDSNWNPKVKVTKAKSPEGSEDSKHEVDALSGATITSVGVESSLLYWLGEQGYGKFLANFRGGNL